MERSRLYAVVTGASAGLGREFAIQLAQEGYSLLLIARRRERLEALQMEIENSWLAAGAACEIMAADLKDLTECERVMTVIHDKPVLIFINNAGYGDCGYFPDTDLAKDLGMVDLNVKTVHFFTKRMIQKMEQQGNGYILNVASSAGLMPGGPYMATYYATKAYVASLTQAVARELEERKSPVYLGALCPGPVDTEFNSVANVEFSLKGITAERCVSCCIEGMKKRKTMIIPTFVMKGTALAGQILPRKTLVAVCGHQQKKKLGK